ncbi:2-hydroxy-3-keto-5-methylthiopentenyl-1-phosphate phosphatase [compost metagenome]
MIGDGASDFCVSEHADFVFAKRRLIAHCTDAGIPHAAIDTFHDATALLPRLLDGSLLQPSLPRLLATA